MSIKGLMYDARAFVSGSPRIEGLNTRPLSGLEMHHHVATALLSVMVRKRGQTDMSFDGPRADWMNTVKRSIREVHADVSRLYQDPGMRRSYYDGALKQVLYSLTLADRMSAGSYTAELTELRKFATDLFQRPAAKTRMLPVGGDAWRKDSTASLFFQIYGEGLQRNAASKSEKKRVEDVIGFIFLNTDNPERELKVVQKAMSMAERIRPKGDQKLFERWQTLAKESAAAARRRIDNPPAHT